MKILPLLHCALLGLALAASLARAEGDDPPEDPRILAKMAKAKAKQNQQQAGTGSPNSNNCGGVDIGNINTPQPVGGVPREVTVIVTGDVINAGNKCK